MFLGNGDGTLGTASIISVPGGPIAVAVGDFNGDGNADIAVASYNNNSISILIGNGAGGFAIPVTYTVGVGSEPQAIIVGDFDGDGNADLAVANYGSQNISVVFGRGDGTFGPGATYPVGTSHPMGIAAGDFNHDGKVDLAVANFGPTSTVSVLLGTGGGAFANAVDYPTTGTGTYSVAVGDFNGDGIPDLITPNNTSNDVSFLPGTGNGTFGAATKFSVGSGPTFIALGDFNGDGKLDIAAASDGVSVVTLLYGDGNGGVASVFDAGVGSGGSGARGLAVGDFNGDGVTDIAVSDYASNTVSILTGIAKAAATMVLTSSGNPSQLGSAVTLTATMTPNTATGTVTFYQDLIPIAVATARFRNSHGDHQTASGRGFGQTL